ncbi:hypothetical protein RvY_13763 [Ramazzottius varieornatus]|uniref:Radial spoke head protein 3 homolog n=1 Tax=Ramazzottius varieornatus TaxID=947166 RepID=A0A1D1VQT9_RAMVA|nr:hypothetical protein RvY_13763 [Ramazzottius varieornatus]
MASIFKVTGSRIPKPEEAEARRSSMKGKTANSIDHIGGRGDHQCSTKTLNIVLEEITDRPIQTGEKAGDAGDQYEPLPFVAATTFVETATMIYHNDLLDFDREVEPLLEVLIGQSLEQALLEVSQEEDELQRKDEVRMYQEYRNAQLAEVQRLDARKVRHDQEKKRRIQEKELAAIRAKKKREQQEMALYAKQYMASLLPEVHCRMKREGYFGNQVRQELSVNFLPWMGENVGKELDDYQAVDLVLQSKERINDMIDVHAVITLVRLNLVMIRKILHENEKTLANDWHDFFDPPIPPTTPITLRPSQYHIKVIPRIVVSPPPAKETPEGEAIAPSAEEPAPQEGEDSDVTATNNSAPTPDQDTTDTSSEDNLPSLTIPPRGMNLDASKSPLQAGSPAR